MTPDALERRRRIMRRSAALGHCVCNPRLPCPCEDFRARDLCACAGERPPAPPGPVRLTAHVRKTGCASKISQRDLEAALAGLPDVADPRIVVGRAAGDDAGVIDLRSDGTTILTVDVFSPSVDDPYTFGRIAAANSLSDIYAMGGRPEVALSIIGFPVHALPLDAMREILRGGIDAMAEAGISVIGGHSIDDEEVKFGFAVVGSAPRKGLACNAGAKAGDAIVLTKPVGTGILAFAGQLGLAPAEGLAEATRSMAALNRLPAERMAARGARAATDVTGFGLLGHLANVARSSGVEVELDVDALPLFPGVAELARREVLPGAVERNAESADPARFDLSALAPAQRRLLFGPETSGGLLVFLPPAEAAAYVEEVRAGGFPRAAVVGRVTGERPGGFIRAVTRQAAGFAPLPPPGREPVPATAAPPPVETACCASTPPVVAAAPAGAPAAGAGEGKPALPLPLLEAFKVYQNAVSVPGAVDLKTRKLIGLSLSVIQRCEPCVKIYADAARKAGATEAEMGEAVALAVAFGGSPVHMFYQTMKT
jgi:selenide,water dikinase